MIPRVFMTTAIAATALVLAYLVFNVVQSPMEARRERLRVQLAEVPASRVDVGPLVSRVDIDAVQESISGKGKLWQELIPPPPPPPPPPEPPPDLAKMLEGVQPTRQRIGDAIRIVVPGNPRGGRFAVGDVINGVTIKEILPGEVVFEYLWKDSVLTYTIPRR